jgi:hypothetical protein
MSKRTDVLDAARVLLKTIDGTGSFNNNLTVVHEVPESPDSGKMPYAILHRGQERYADAGGALTERRLEVLVEAWARFSSPAEKASDAADKLLEDIERAVGSDRSLGGTVIDVTLGKNQQFTTTAGDSIVVVVVEAEIRYRHTHGSP